MALPPVALLLLLGTAVAVAWAPLVHALPRIDAPCSACRAIAGELEKRLEEEPTRNHLDLRHRLDSQGQRYGKVIDYKVSELRAVELLENLCGSLNNKWTLVTVPSGGGGAADGKTRKTVHWERTVEAAPGSRPGTQEEEVRQKQLTSFCGSVLDEHDEELTDAIKEGVLEEKGVSQWLCHDLVGACPVGSQGTGGSKVLPRKGALPETSDGTTSAAVAAAEAAAKAKAAASQAPPPPPPPPKEFAQEVKVPGMDKDEKESDISWHGAAVDQAAKVAETLGLKIDGLNDPETLAKQQRRDKRKKKKKASSAKAEL